MGLGIAALAYAWMINHDIRPWLAALAVAPLLLDGYLLQLEQLLLSDTLFSLMVTTAFVVLLWRRRKKSLGPLVFVGALLGLATTTRTVGVGLIVLGVSAFALRKPSWKGAAALLVSVAIPLASYASWFRSNYGEFGLTERSSMPASCRGLIARESA
jgi:4-amino-4-deoxy-L-arabinose transferase-like glycosyltransferase